MNDAPRSATMTVPVTMKIGPIPEDLTSFAQVYTFALANISKILRDAGISAKLSGEHAVITYSDGGATPESFTAGGVSVDRRHFRMQPDDHLGHSLEISVDGGQSFDKAASFSDFALGEAIGRAWSDGRTEKGR